MNNAGRGDSGDIESVTRAEFDRIVALTQTSVFLGMQCAGDALKSSGRGSVVNIDSICGVSGTMGKMVAYHSAKGAVRTMTKNVALLWAPQGVRVNSVHPGYIRTPPVVERGSALLDELATATPMGRLGEPSEIAAAVAFLASDDASFITGAELYVDGGFLAR